MTIRNQMTLAAVACVLGTATVGTSMPLYADDAGAFIGGVFREAGALHLCKGCGRE